MQWAYRIRRKISPAWLLAAIFVLVFVKSMVEDQYVAEFGNSFVTVYEDRPVVESYIYRLTDPEGAKDNSKQGLSCTVFLIICADHGHRIDTNVQTTKLTIGFNRFIHPAEGPFRAAHTLRRFPRTTIIRKQGNIFESTSVLKEPAGKGSLH